MNDDQLGLLLRDALDTHAHQAVADERPVPPRRVTHGTDTGPVRGRHRRWLAPALAAAVVLALVVGVLLVGTRGSGRHSAPAAPVDGVPVTVSFPAANGTTYGVGQPVIVRFDRTITDARAFVAHTVVTVNGTPAQGAWYFLRAAGGGLEAHYRLRDYWPGHATITVRADLRGRTAGAGLVFADNPSLTLHTGAARVSVVDGSAHTMRVSVDGRVVRQIPVSLGSRQYRTYSGTAVVLARYPSIRLTKPGVYSEIVRYAVRLTTSGTSSTTGDYVIAMAATTYQQGRSNVTHGSVDLSTTNARWFYELARPGDVVTFVHTGGPTVGLTNGVGDWNVPWTTWQGGGIVPTH